MDFKKLLQSLDQLNEAEMTSRKVAGKAYGGAAQHDDDEDDEEGTKKASAPAVKRGRGRPKKLGGDADTAAKYGGAKELQNWIVGNVPKDSKALKKLPKTKHSLKEYVENIDEMMSQMPIPVVGKQGSTQSTGAGFLNIDDSSPAGQAMKDAIGKLAQQKKAQIVVPTATQTTGSTTSQPTMSEEDYSAKKARAGKDIGKPGKQFAKIAKSAAERYGSKERGEKVAGAVLAKLRKTNEADMPPNDSLSSPLTLESKQGVAEGKEDKIAKHNAAVAKMTKRSFANLDYSHPDLLKTAPKGYSFSISNKLVPKKGVAEGSVDHRALGKHHEEMTDQELRKVGSKLPDSWDAVVFRRKLASHPKYAQALKHYDKSEYHFGKAARQGVAEGMSQRLQAARLEGRAHGLKGHSHCGKNYEDMEEARCYHEGYKEGLDECYGMMPIRGVVGEETPAATVPGMASQSMSMPTMEDDMEEGNAFTAALAKTPKDVKFSVGGKSFTDQSDYDAKVDEMMMAFEGWDKQLNALLTEGEVVEEGMSISVSKGQQGAPDSVSVTANDAEADSLMALVKQLGVFGDEKPSGYGAPEGEMSHSHGDINVVNDHDGMMALMKKLSGQEQGSEDYADEEHDHDHGHEEDHNDLEVCEVCGESDCGCDDEMVDETETPDQMEFEVSEDNAPDSDAAETTADEDAEAQEDAALAKADELNEWANEAGKNGTDEAFDTDIAFMTKIISGGLNKQKSTGQTTVPVIANQNSRMGVDGMNEGTDTLVDWKKLSGIR